MDQFSFSVTHPLADFISLVALVIANTVMTSTYIYPFQTFPYSPDSHHPTASTSLCGTEHAKAKLDSSLEPSLLQSPCLMTVSPF